MVADGCVMVGVEINPELADQARRLMPAPNEIVVGDVADYGVLQAGSSGSTITGKLYGWVNSAGIDRPGNLHQVNSDEVELILYLSTSTAATGAVPAPCRSSSERRSGGAIVNVSSSARAGRLRRTTRAYDASKGAIDALTRVRGRRVRPLNIRG